MRRAVIFIGCLLSLGFISTIVSAKSLQELQNEYQHYKALINNNNVIWLSSPVGNQESGYISAGTHSLDDLKQLLWDKTLVNPSITYDDYISSIAVLVDLSNQTKRTARESLLPQLEQEISRRGGSITSGGSGQNIGNTFSQVMNSLSSDNHIASVSFDNMNDVINAGVECPKYNPGSRRTFKIYPNGQNSGNTYLLCGYFGDGSINFEKPYVHGKIDGKFITWGQRNGTHYVSERSNWRNGVLHGLKETYMLSKSGAVFRQHMMTYADGKQHGDQASWWENGRPKKDSKFYYGKPQRANNYGEDGSFQYCTEWQTDGLPRDCTTGKRRKG